jgi:hypothetical protein
MAPRWRAGKPSAGRRCGTAGYPVSGETLGGSHRRARARGPTRQGSSSGSRGQQASALSGERRLLVRPVPGPGWPVSAVRRTVRLPGCRSPSRGPAPSPGGPARGRRPAPARIRSACHSSLQMSGKDRRGYGIGHEAGERRGKQWLRTRMCSGITGPRPACRQRATRLRPLICQPGKHEREHGPGAGTAIIPADRGCPVRDMRGRT